MLENLFRRIIFFIFLSLFIAISLVFYPLVLLTWLCTATFDPRLVWTNKVTSLWGQIFIFLVPVWSLKVINRNLIDPNRTYVFVSNHQSILDILIAFSLHAHFKWISKSRIFKWPLVGWAMRLNEYVSLGEGRRQDIKSMNVACENHLKNGNSIYMFPEGTRSLDGKMGSFRKGAFTLAQKAQVDILLVVLDNSSQAMPKYNCRYQGKTLMTVKVIKSIPYEQHKELTSLELAKQTQDCISQELDNLVSMRIHG